MVAIPPAGIEWDEWDGTENASSSSMCRLLLVVRSSRSPLIRNNSSTAPTTSTMTAARAPHVVRTFLNIKYPLANDPKFCRLRELRYWRTSIVDDDDTVDNSESRRLSPTDFHGQKFFVK